MKLKESETLSLILASCCESSLSLSLSLSLSFSLSFSLSLSFSQHPSCLVKIRIYEFFWLVCCNFILSHVLVFSVATFHSKISAKYCAKNPEESVNEHSKRTVPIEENLTMQLKDQLLLESRDSYARNGYSRNTYNGNNGYSRRDHNSNRASYSNYDDDYFYGCLFALELLSFVQMFF